MRLFAILSLTAKRSTYDYNIKTHVLHAILTRKSPLSKEKASLVA